MTNNITSRTAYSRSQFKKGLVDFSAGPEGDPVSWTIGVYVFAPVDTFFLDASAPITFTGTATPPPRLDPGADLDRTPVPSLVIEWFWEFGDGTIGYGNPVDHQYTLSNSNTQVKLRVTDDQARKWRVEKQIYLVNSESLFPSSGLYPSSSLFPGH